MTQTGDALYQRLFRASPGKILVLRPENFEIIAVTDEYLRATMTREGDLVGKTVFEVFPDDPDDLSADGVKALSTSLQRVLAMKSPDIMGVQRYPIRLPSGKYEERFWSPVNSPVLDDAGAVEYIMHRVEDVTDIVQEEDTESLSATDNRLALQDIVVRSRELRQALSKLQEHEARMRTAERLLRLGTWEYNPRTGHLNWSRQVFDIYDVPHWSSAPDLKRYFAMVHPDDRDAARAIYQSFFDNREPQIVFEHRVIGRDGRSRYIRGVGERHMIADDEIIVGYVQDITSLVTTRNKLTQAEQHRRNILESISDAFYALDRQWQFTYLNQQAGVLLNRPGDELLGKNVWTEFPEASGSQIEQQYQKALETQKTVRFRAFYEPLDKWFDISAYPIPDGLAVYFRDVTLEREHQERFNLISKATNDVIWDWNLSTDDVWWNDSMTQLFGYPLAELEPGSESWTRRIHPDDLEQAVNSIHEVIAGDEEHWTLEYRFIKRDGKVANVVDRGFVIRNANGQATRMVGSMLDITERIELEQRLRESQKLEAVGHLTGGVAHDFNNLLTVILGNSEMMVELATDPELQVMAEMTVSAATRGAELTSRLLAFARRQPLDPKPTDLNQLVEAMRGLIRRTLPENIELVLSPAPDLGIVEIDAGELDTALLNLVVNARDAMPGGGKLTIETTNTLLDEDYAQRHTEISPGEYVMIGVSDSGKGMNPEIVGRVFEPFFTTKSVGKGSGLGLSMVFGFTKQSGGHISIYSEPNEGTSVKLFFPRVRGLQKTTYQPASELLPEGGNEHILIAEDDRLVLQHLERQLRSLGYQVTAVTSGPEALRALEKDNDIDLLLTDIVMPGGMNGRQLADKARETYPSLKVLFTSGYTENAVVHQGRLDPGVELLSKPYTRIELATKVQRVLRGESL